MRHKRGDPLWVSTSAHLRSGGGPQEIEGVFRSIEERKQLERMLRGQANLTQSLIDATNDGAILIDAAGTLLAVNTVFANRFRQPIDALVGTCVWSLFPPDVAEARRSVTQETLIRGSMTHLRDERDGHHFTNVIYPVANSDGQFDRIAFFSRDVTAEVEGQRRIDSYIAEIKRSNEELEQFAYVVSHDLREPLRMISSYLSLIERRYTAQFDRDGLDFIAFARDGAIRMDRLVRELLDLSRIGRLGAPMVRMPIRPAIDQALRSLSAAIESEGAVIDCDPRLDAIEIAGDGNQIAQLFQNLIGNAIKYHTPDRAPIVAVGCRDMPGEPVFFVKDNGIGIESRDFERIFGIFQRLHARDAYEGTGIGLAICKKIVERHGGRIWVESSPGAGTTFAFTLPAAPTEITRDPERQAG
jgi:PAS domain S-box-containing protein